MMDVRERLAGEAAGRLPELVRAALGESGATPGAWEVEPLPDAFGARAGGSSLHLLRGVARVGAAERPWEAVFKVLAPGPEHGDPAAITYRRRELHLYRPGILDRLPAGLRAPRCYGCDEWADGSAWLWLERVREDGERVWPLARWALAARHLGQLNGAYLAGLPLPLAPGLGGRRLRSWLERYHPLLPLIAAAPDNPAVRAWWPRPVVDAILLLWDEREAFCAALERLPPTFGHGDAIRRNLLSRQADDGTVETVGVDWEHAGYYAAGEEVGQTLSVAGAFFDWEPADLPALDDALFAGYLAGLRDAGWRGDPRPVRFAYAAHAALRNLFNAVGASVPDPERRAAARQNYGHTWEELAERRSAVRPFLLERAEEARKLVGSI